MKTVLKGLILSVLITGIAIVGGGCPGIGTRNNQSAPKALAMGEISYFDMDGNKVNLSSLAKGRPMYLTFFASWCTSCKREVKEINGIFHEYAARGLAVYSVNVGDSRKNIEQFIKKYKINYPVLQDPGGKTSGEKLDLVSLPLNVVVDGTGRVMYRGVIPPSERVLEMALKAGK